MSMSFKKSEMLWEKAIRVIPGGASTEARRASAFPKGSYPLYAARGEGAYLYDVDGNRYIDCVSAWGPVVLGHNYGPVSDAVRNQISLGTVFNINTEGEITLAEKYIDLIPSAEMVRFMLSGSDATLMSIRLARIYTGRNKIIRCGYHGWYDWSVVDSNRLNPFFVSYCKEIGCGDCFEDDTKIGGVPSDLRNYVMTTTYNDAKGLEVLIKEHRDEIACIIMEPVYDELPVNGYLQFVRDLADKNGIVLIFDEVKTGFRVAIGGAQEYFGVVPDISAFGKAIANGYPLSAVVGKREIMECAKKSFFCGSHFGYPIGIEAALATINELCTKPVIEHLWENGGMLFEGLKTIVEKLHIGNEVRCVGFPSMPWLSFGAPHVEEMFMAECARRGVLVCRKHAWFISYSHTKEDIENVLAVVEESLGKVQQEV